MLITYFKNGSSTQWLETSEKNQRQLEEALWIDLICPTDEEENTVEKYLGLDIPTKKEMGKIELSGRLYAENDNLFMTTTMVAQSDSPNPVTDAVTFILTGEKLITVRYIEPLSFKLFSSLLARAGGKEYNPEKLLIGLLESSTDRLADILEKVSHKFDDISQAIFCQNKQEKSTSKTDYQKILQNIGVNGDLGTKVRESLLSFVRLLSFLEENPGARFSIKEQSRLKIMNKDIEELSNYDSFISTKVSFLLDATLGMINIQQNNIIKLFSVAAVVFLPPTLIASIYGMNFEHMPELDWYIGYPLVIVLMVMSAILPYRYFKRRKWL